MVARSDTEKFVRTNGEWTLLTRNIDRHPSGPAASEKIFHVMQRCCIVFSVSALILGLLDLAGIRNASSAAAFINADNAAAFINENRQRVAELPDRIRSGIELISFDTSSPSAVVAIPRDALNGIVSPVAGLDEVQRKDAVEFAMKQPHGKIVPSFAAAKLTPAELRIAAEAASLSALAAEPFRLASAESTPASAVQVSLPMASAMPLDMVPMPRPAPGAPPPSPAERLHLEGKERIRAERCLANAIYFESRSEPVRGQMAVAQVVLNRAFSGFYPNDICGVVYQNAGRHLACQFTFACDGKSKAINERGAWARANRIAKQTLDGQIYVPEVAKSTHYHAIYVHPNWTGEMKKMVRYGIHNFYRPFAWGNGDEDPVWGSGAMASAKKN
jgi:cell wall hydrolase